MGLRDAIKAATNYTDQQWEDVARLAREVRVGSGAGDGRIHQVMLLPQFFRQWPRELSTIERAGWKLEHLTPYGPPATGSPVSATLATFRAV